jgi:mRNA interferase RelE/StbE
VTYRIEVTPAARRDLANLPRNILQRVDRKILALAADPFPVGTKKLEGADEFFRLRVGDYRVIYRVERRHLVILIVRIRHRKEVYREKFR